MSKVLVFDPGESTGWMCAELEENSEGMMVIKELQGVHFLKIILQF